MTMRVPFCLFVICLCLLSVNAVPRGPVKMKNPRNGRVFFVSFAGNKQDGTPIYRAYDWLSRVRLLAKASIGHFNEILLRLRPSRPGVNAIFRHLATGQ
uniref:Secreted protein n=1 Tax=Magallana gigas TaxID=29159 RepID=A0A8W8P1M0_MAGGI